MKLDNHPLKDKKFINLAILTIILALLTTCLLVCIENYFKDPHCWHQMYKDGNISVERCCKCGKEKFKEIN